MAAVPDSVVSFGAIWTWFNDPRCVYDSARDTLYFGAIEPTGVISIHAWDYTRSLLFYGTPLSSVLELDDHNNPALCLLSSGKILAAYSQHDGDSYSARTVNAGDIRTWETPVAVASGSNDDSYAHLVQMDDTAETVFWFYRRAPSNPRTIAFRSSTDDGDTWGGDTTLFSDGSGRPYFKCVKTSGSRIDFVVSTGHPGESANSLYHGYITVASDGSFTYFQTDGTQVTSPPFTPSEFTLVYDGSTNDGWQWDIHNFSGTPVIVYATFESSDAVHRYYQARWSGSAWQSDEVTTGGTTATADYLYAAQTHYSGGIALDPNDIDAVYAVREYGAANFRLEKWTHSGSFPSGTWAKDSDTSGDTSSVNARPYCPRGLSPTKVLWWEGSYTSFTSYATRLRMSPAPAWKKSKESSPVWTASYAPVGVQAYYLFHEGSGNVTDLTGNGYTGTITGTPTWNAGAGDDFGAFMSGFSTSNYVNLDALAAALDETDFPVWIFVLYKTTSTGTTQQWSVGLGNSGTNNPIFGTIHNTGNQTNVGMFWRDTAGAGAVAAGNVAGSNDGEFHVLSAVKAGNSSANGRWDGTLAGFSSTATGATAINVGAIGALRRAAVSNAFAGEVHAVVIGSGDEPNRYFWAMDLIRGQFLGTFNPDATGNRRRRLLLCRRAA